MRWPLLAVLVIICSFIGSLAADFVFGEIAKHWLQTHMQSILQMFVNQLDAYFGGL
ncbi:hypothetical protein [Alicyclobacillus fodiniaquatilis]|jgi:hypothetical protein|uniref:Uncharacterized protein n=1 Tax=Alicyclobacillus fodiniaquatilis TaxID=1661150 RepID=A0ABW4JMN7_9BACL